MDEFERETKRRVAWVNKCAGTLLIAAKQGRDMHIGLIKENRRIMRTALKAELRCQPTFPDAAARAIMRRQIAYWETCVREYEDRQRKLIRLLVNDDFRLASFEHKHALVKMAIDTTIMSFNRLIAERDQLYREKKRTKYRRAFGPAIQRQAKLTAARMPGVARAACSRNVPVLGY